jgi:hypothetical protein
MHMTWSELLGTWENFKDCIGSKNAASVFSSYSHTKEKLCHSDNSIDVDLVFQRLTFLQCTNCNCLSISVVLQQNVLSIMLELQKPGCPALSVFRYYSLVVLFSLDFSFFFPFNFNAALNYCNAEEWNSIIVSLFCVWLCAPVFLCMQ